MDAKLLKEREAFKKRAAAATDLEAQFKKSRNDQTSVLDAVAKAKSRRVHQTPKRPGPPKQEKKSDDVIFDYKTAKSVPTASFGVLAKIVDFLRKRHLDSATFPMPLNEILTDLHIYDMNNKSKEWLMSVMPNNPSIRMDDENRFIYKPPYPVKNQKTLQKELRKRDMENTGGLLMSELANCMHNPDVAIKALGNQVIEIPTKTSKRADKVLFHNEPDTEIQIDEELVQLWRSVNIQHLDERKIDEYLQKHGIHSMKDLAPKTHNNQGSSLKRRKSKRPQQLQNEHMADKLIDFSQK